MHNPSPSPSVRSAGSVLKGPRNLDLTSSDESYETESADDRSDMSYSIFKYQPEDHAPPGSQVPLSAMLDRMIDGVPGSNVMAPMTIEPGISGVIVSGISSPVSGMTYP